RHPLEHVVPMPQETSHSCVSQQQHRFPLDHAPRPGVLSSTSTWTNRPCQKRSRHVACTARDVEVRVPYVHTSYLTCTPNDHERSIAGAAHGQAPVAPSAPLSTCSLLSLWRSQRRRPRVRTKRAA